MRSTSATHTCHAISEHKSFFFKCGKCSLCACHPKCHTHDMPLCWGPHVHVMCQHTCHLFMVSHTVDIHSLGPTSVTLAYHQVLADICFLQCATCIAWICNLRQTCVQLQGNICKFLLQCVTCGKHHHMWPKYASSHVPKSVNFFTNIITWVTHKCCLWFTCNILNYCSTYDPFLITHDR